MREEDNEARTQSHVWTATSSGESLSIVAFWSGHVVARSLAPGISLTAGRAHDCELFIDHKSVSRRHARVHVGERIEIEDLGSSNGTRVGGRVLKSERVMLEPGQLVGVGAVTLMVQVGADAIRSYGAPAATSAPMPWPDDGPMGRVAELLRLLARGDISVLLLGETGVGKEVAARALHQASRRASSAFIAFNCAATPQSLLESELFGHERGAFTGATAAKPGLVEAAHGGTLFLDEIGEMAPATQAKLLRVLESGEIRRLGSVSPRRVDVRFVSATNRNLVTSVESGDFRRDLFFRLAGMPIEIPPLRERRRELFGLAERFIRETSQKLGTPAPELSERARAALEAHDFPGNIRELKNVIERAVLLAQAGRIEPGDLALTSGSATSSTGAGDLRSSVRDFERQRILDALETTGGNQTAAAELLGIGRRTLIDKMNSYGIAGRKR